MRNNIYKVARIAGLIALGLVVPNAYAFGLSDVISGGLQLGGKVVSAGIDKAKDAMRDPAAEAEKQRKEQEAAFKRFQETLASVETHTELTPLQRERMVIALKKQYENSLKMRDMIQQAEEQQRANRAQIFTPGGFISAVGETAASLPSVQMAEANAMARSPSYRAKMKAENDAAIKQADAIVAAGIPQSGAKRNLAMADKAMGQVPTIQSPNNGQIMNSDQLDTVQKSEEQVTVVSDSPAPGKNVVGQNAFSMDQGKSIWIEFENSQKETDRLRHYLGAHGYSLASQKNAADVVYLLEGEFTIQGTKQYGGIKKDAGNLLDNPDQVIPAPEKKLSGTIGLGFNHLVTAMASFQGHAVPDAAIAKEQDSFKQEMLLVIARQPKAGQETRVSVSKEDDENSIEAAKLALAAKNDLYSILGIQ